MKKTKTFLSVLIILCLLIMLAIVIAVNIKSNYQIDDLDNESFNIVTVIKYLKSKDLKSIIKKMFYKSDTNVVNILLLGTDYKIEDTSDEGRADSNIIFSLNKKTGAVKIISIERGIYVPIPEGLMPDGGTSDLLTHAYHWGGAELSEQIVSECFNVNLDGYAQVDIEGFATIIDVMGGVDVEISEDEAQALNGNAGIEISADKIAENEMHEGVNHLNGHDATCLCRLRYIDDDWQRVERQRRVVSAAIDKAKTLSVDELTELVNVLIPLINTNISATKLLSLATKLPNLIKNITIEQMTTPEQGSNIDFEYESKRINDFIYG